MRHNAIARFSVGNLLIPNTKQFSYLTKKPGRCSKIESAPNIFFSG